MVVCVLEDLDNDLEMEVGHDYVCPMRSINQVKSSSKLGPLLGVLGP